MLRIRLEEYVQLDTMEDYLQWLEKNRAPHAIEKFGCPKVSVQTTVSEGKSLTTLF